MILFLQRWPGLPGVWFRPHGFCVTACIVAAQITGFQDQACAQTTARVGVCQTATGFARSPETSAVIGLPAPLRAIQTGNRSSSVLMSQGSIDVPLEFGNRVSWKLYDVGGREVQSGAANIPETGSRSIRVGSAQGLCVVVLTSADGLSVLRKAVFFER
ncbi:MAG: hypothetical protein HYX66_07890 [Ignavibacteria bacterium]|nr:hypothetical protein [Ignavibacteria bacterium]